MNRSSKNPWRRTAWLGTWLCGGAVILMLASSSWAIDQQRFQATSQLPAVAEDQQPQGRRDRDQQRLIHPRPSPGWVLGVRVDNLPTGVRITYVLPNSAAWRAGLEVRDVIVSVQGYQVGYVGRQLYDLESELQLRADRSGRVRLLAWNHRDGELVNLDVVLDRHRPPVPLPDRPGIRGTLNFNAAVRSADRGELVVQLADITDRLLGHKPVAEQRIAFTGQLPVSFHLDVDPDQLPLPRRYELLAYLEVDGNRMLATLPGLYLLNRVDVRNVEMTLHPIRFDRRR